MGMFDWVKTPKLHCRKCGALLEGFQSKDGPCELATFEYWEVNEFHTSCTECDTWHQFVLKERRSFLPIEYYEDIAEEDGDD